SPSPWSSLPCFQPLSGWPSPLWSPLWCRSSQRCSSGCRWVIIASQRPAMARAWVAHSGRPLWSKASASEFHQSWQAFTRAAVSADGAGVAGPQTAVAAAAQTDGAAPSTGTVGGVGALAGSGAVVVVVGFNGLVGAGPVGGTTGAGSLTGTATTGAGAVVVVSSTAGG